GQALVGDLSQHAAHDAAQRIVDESVVVKAVVHVVPGLSRSIGLRFRRVNRSESRKTLVESGRASVARCPPEPRLRPLFRRQQRVQGRYRWHWCVARHGGTIPGKNRAFTTLVDPISPPLVEAPGTAPGSDTLMPRGVYRHSRFPDAPNISVRAAFLKATAVPT